MKVMIKFEMPVLNEMSYASLSNMANKLRYSLEITKKIRKKFVDSGSIRKSAGAEASIIRIKENLTLINLVMLSKENDVMESFKLGIEPICLN